MHATHYLFPVESNSRRHEITSNKNARIIGENDIKCMTIMYLLNVSVMNFADEFIYCCVFHQENINLYETPFAAYSIHT